MDNSEFKNFMHISSIKLPQLPCYVAYGEYINIIP